MTSLMSLLLLFSGTEVTISEEPKMISAVEPVPGNEEIVQGTPFLTNMCPQPHTPAPHADQHGTVLWSDVFIQT
jgi:hypothetical protein